LRSNKNDFEPLHLGTTKNKESHDFWLSFEQAQHSCPSANFAMVASVTKKEKDLKREEASHFCCAG
jgi:hypothetical protein